MNMSSPQMQRRREGATRYARVDSSDPHCFNRAMSHATNGVVGHDMYDADTFPGQRPIDPRWDKLNELRERMKMPPLREVQCTAYRNVVRP